MSARIRFDPDPMRMLGTLSAVPAFPGESFRLNLPEVIGDASQVVQTENLSPGWTNPGAGVWRAAVQVPGELDFVLTVTLGVDTADLHVSLTNQSTRDWAQSLAFHCFNCGAAPSVADFECARTWGRCGTAMHRLIELPRQFSPRPTVQIYSVLGAPPAMQIPFVAAFSATPAEVLEGWLAIQSRDGGGIAAAVSSPPLFVFQNMEFSCLHSAPSFGALHPGQTGEALTRLYLVRASLHDWYRRMKSEMGP